MIEKYITGSLFTNSYVISNSSGECVIVDPGLNYAQAARQIKEKYQVKAILLTHGHADHIDGIQYFQAPVYLHEREVDFLSDATLSLYNMLGLRMPFKRDSLDIHVVHDLEVIPLIGYEFHVLYTPGHTRGSVCYSYGTKVLSGDTLFCGSCGRTDFPTGDSLSIRNSLQRIIEYYPDTYDVYPGHDEKTTIRREKHNPFIG